MSLLDNFAKNSSDKHSANLLFHVVTSEGTFLSSRKKCNYGALLKVSLDFS